MSVMLCRRALVRGVLWAAVIAITGSPLAWAQSMPEAVVAKIYKLQDAGEESPIYEPELMERFLTSELVALINADLDQVQGRMDFDPLYGTDDVEVTDFATQTQSITGDSSVVLVTFKNFGKPTSVTFDLAREDGQWKVSNIRTTRWNLLELLQ